jgi:thiamine pyrophosphate-dependent acetolactate synthase large subunit-like protein
MSTPQLPTTGGQLLIRRLRDLGVRHVFGYPGGPLTPLYDALYHEPSIRHVLARDEQAAGFMADGYARVTGRPGVFFAVCGPGVFNAVTPIATAFSDSVPVLLIGGQVPTRAHGGSRSGFYHENDQISAFASITKHRSRIERVDDIGAAVDTAWQQMTHGRPGPVFLDAPVDVMASAAPVRDSAPLPSAGSLTFPETMDLLRLLQSWKQPLLIAGGGVVTAGAEAELVQVAERLGAPVFHTFLGKGAIPSLHPLCAGTPWQESTSDASDMASRISPLFAQADGLLAIGCRFTQVITGSWALKPPAALAQIDIDPEEIGRHYPVTLGLVADARLALGALLPMLPATARTPWAPPPGPRPVRRLGGWDLLGPLRRAIPQDAIVVADVTQLGYMMLVDHPVSRSRRFLHPAAAVSMGFGLPAALGAKVAFPDLPVVAVMGDGCFQMTGMELATAVQEKLPVVVVLVNDSTLTLIKAIQKRRFGQRYLGVDLRNPDFTQLAKAFGVRTWKVTAESAFEPALADAIACGEPALVEVVLTNTLPG